MAGIFTYRTINFDVANGAPAAVYTVPASTQTVVRLILAVNTNAGTQTVNVQFQPNAGTARQIGQVNASLLTGAEYRDVSVYLLGTPGDAILMGASVATDVKGTIVVAEET